MVSLGMILFFVGLKGPFVKCHKLVKLRGAEVEYFEIS